MTPRLILSAIFSLLLVTQSYAQSGPAGTLEPTIGAGLEDTAAFRNWLAKETPGNQKRYRNTLRRVILTHGQGLRLAEIESAAEDAFVAYAISFSGSPPSHAYSPNGYVVRPGLIGSGVDISKATLFGFLNEFKDMLAEKRREVIGQEFFYQLQQLGGGDVD